MSKQSQQHVVIVGGGLAGALMGCYLGRAGYRVEIYEKRPDPRVAGFVGGRSINLALSTRGITALREVGVADRVLKNAVAMPGRMIHDARGHVTFQSYSRNPNDAIHSVARGGLNITLLDKADEYENVLLHFGHTCMNVDLDRPTLEFATEGTPGSERVSCDFVIGADGAFSAVRASMLHGVSNFSFSQSFLEHGYKELCIPRAEGGGFRMEDRALHIWPRGGSMMIALPNDDRSFTCTLFWPHAGKHSFESVSGANGIEQFFEEQYPDAVPHMPLLTEDYQANPVGPLMTVRCTPWNVGGRVLLIGDAAHAIVPFFGQGMNAAFEDCRILNQILFKNPYDVERVFSEFSRERKEDVDAIADMALANFIEMRDKTASVCFRLRKKLEQRLHALMPRAFTPLYNMISFSNVPYAEALAKSQRQNQTLRRIGWAAVLTMAAVALIVATLLLVSSAGNL